MKLGSNANYSVMKNKIKTRQYSRSELTYFFANANRNALKMDEVLLNL